MTQKFDQDPDPLDTHWFGFLDPDPYPDPR
jgi:hypothetical protein